MWCVAFPLPIKQEQMIDQPLIECWEPSAMGRVGGGGKTRHPQVIPVPRDSALTFTAPISNLSIQSHSSVFSTLFIFYSCGEVHFIVTGFR